MYWRSSRHPTTVGQYGLTSNTAFCPEHQSSDAAMRLWVARSIVYNERSGMSNQKYVGWVEQMQWNRCLFPTKPCRICYYVSYKIKPCGYAVRSCWNVKQQTWRLKALWQCSQVWSLATGFRSAWGSWAINSHGVPEQCSFSTVAKIAQPQCQTWAWGWLQ